ncbi:hypothetical protein TRFO_01831 [Tritrichomonas foetus]|uniref:Uncharacterized protein n=1 Tax=Tritrichomonas foetus TaxID=1144522 RepID=A0A1J4JMM3_9EUKA|nr:hypothetical protein TRFO_01831 [Tritrichomonas foetus]|eukprot:OHS98787.1 hypothetical protein TRFO_01831 [Tritrichomonas foetus]
MSENLTAAVCKCQFKLTVEMKQTLILKQILGMLVEQANLVAIQGHLNMIIHCQIESHVLIPPKQLILQVLKHSLKLMIHLEVVKLNPLIQNTQEPQDQLINYNNNNRSNINNINNMKKKLKKMKHRDINIKSKNQKILDMDMKKKTKMKITLEETKKKSLKMQVLKKKHLIELTIHIIILKFLTLKILHPTFMIN